MPPIFIPSPFLKFKLPNLGGVRVVITFEQLQDVDVNLGQTTRGKFKVTNIHVVQLF